MQIAIVILAKNEAATIEKVVQGCQGWGDVWVVTDAGTTDDTAKIAMQAGANWIYATPPGLASSLRAGLGLCDKYDRIVTIDAGGSHDPAQISRLLLWFPNADLVIGSRFWCVSAFKQTLWRKALTYGAAILLAPLLGWGDWTSGFRCYDGQMLKMLQARPSIMDPLGRIDVLSNLRSKGHAIQFELAWWIKRLGSGAKFVPISYHGTTSQVNRGAVLEALRVWLHLIRLSLSW